MILPFSLGIPGIHPWKPSWEHYAHPTPPSAELITRWFEAVPDGPGEDQEEGLQGPGTLK